MRMSQALVALLFAALVLGALPLGCSTSSSSGGSSSSGQEPATTAGGSALTSLQQALSVADSVFNFDPDLAPGDNAQGNARTMETRSKTSTAACPNTKITLTLTTLTIDFGPPPGCKLASGGTVSGALEASVSGGGAGLRDGGILDGGDGIRDGGGDLGDGGARALTVTLKFTQLNANGLALDGTIAFTTSTGSTFDVTITSFTTAMGKLDGKLTVVGTPGSIQVDGDLSLSAADASFASMKLVGVIFHPNDCYPSAGTETTVLFGKTVSTYDSSTASSGKYTKQVGERKPETAYLQPYGNCPPGPPGPGDAAGQ